MYLDKKYKILTHVFEGGKNQLNYIVQFLSVKFIIYISKFWIYPKKTFWMSAIFKYVGAAFGKPVLFPAILHPV
jgi:hypothetical protein